MQIQNKTTKLLNEKKVFKKLFYFSKMTHNTLRFTFQAPKLAHGKKGGELHHFNKQVLVIMQSEE
jgi:hypothetical protein